MKLSGYNKEFEAWVVKMEEKYSGNNISSLSSTDDISVALKDREQLRERCNAVGNKLSFKQKQFEHFDGLLKEFESYVG